MFPNNILGIQIKLWSDWQHVQMLLGFGATGALIYCWWECELLQLLWRSVWHNLVKLKLCLSYNPEVPFLDIHPTTITGHEMWLQTLLSINISGQNFASCIFIFFCISYLNICQLTLQTCIWTCITKYITK